MALTEEERAERKAGREAEYQAKLHEWVERETAKAPPLSESQRARLSVLLRPMREGLTELAQERQKRARGRKK